MSGLRLSQPIIGTVGGHLQSRCTSHRSDFPGALQIARRHMNVATPLDLSQVVTPRKIQDGGRGELPETDRDKPA